MCGEGLMSCLDVTLQLFNCKMYSKMSAIIYLFMLIVTYGKLNT